MTDAYVQIGADGLGKKIDNSLLSVGGNQVYRQRVEAYLSGVDDLGNTVAVPVTPEGHLEVAIHGPLNPFGSVHTEHLTPIFQTDPVYGLNAQEVTATTGLGYDPGPTPGSNTGSVSAANNLFTCSTGTTAYSFGSMQSRKRLRYRAGQGVVGRFTALWGTPAASSVVVAGFGTSESGYYFGYNGTSFGVLQSTGGVRAILTLTITAAATGGTSTFRLNGLDYTVTLPSGAASISRTCYDISKQEFPGYSVVARGNTVIFLANSVGPKAGTFTLTRGTEAAIVGTFATTLTGVAGTDTWIAQADWNGCPCAIDTTKGNVFQIGVAYLGFGPVVFSVMTPSTDGNNSSWVVVHTINNPNARTTPHNNQPSYPFTMAAYSAGSTSNVSVSVGSFAGFIEGQRKFTGPRMSYFNTTGVSSSTSAYTPIFTVRNDTTYSTRANQSVSYLLSVGGAAVSNTGITSFYVIRDATLTGPVNFQAYAATSNSYVDTAATGCSFASQSQVVWTGTVAKDGNFVFSFTDDTTLQPGESLTVAVRSVTATAVCVGQINTREDQ